MKFQDGDGEPLWKKMKSTDDILDEAFGTEESWAEQYPSGQWDTRTGRAQARKNKNDFADLFHKHWVDYGGKEWWPGTASRSDEAAEEEPGMFRSEAEHRVFNNMWKVMTVATNERYGRDPRMTALASEISRMNKEGLEWEDIQAERDAAAKEKGFDSHEDYIADEYGLTADAMYGDLMKEPEAADQGAAEAEGAEEEKKSSSTRCEDGTHKNRKTGNCEPI